MPDEIQEGVIYISIKYCTAIHKCVCGCKNDVVTPLSPTDWELTYDGESVSLYPSIGNWNFPCRSHYWITNNIVKYAKMWSDKDIALGRAMDEMKKKTYYKKKRKGNGEGD